MFVEGVSLVSLPRPRSPAVTPGPEVVTLRQRDLTSSLTTSGKRKPKWFQETLKEAKENVGELKSQIRDNIPPVRFGAYLALVMSLRDIEPQTFAQVVDQQVWREAMVEEYESIVRNDVWEVVPGLVGKSVVTSRWLYKTKFAVDGSIEKHKARFVVRGFSQIEGVDYDETFTPVLRYTSIRSIIAIAAEMGWSIHQMDVKTAFVNGFIDEEVYIEQPQGFQEVYIEQPHTCFRWASRREMLILTSTTSLEVRTCSFSFYMWMTCSSLEPRIS
jgi:hypothetical protein